MNAPHHPFRRFTNADVRRMVEVGIMAENERVELIRGELVPMAAEHDLHARARALLTRIFARTLGPEFFVASNTSLFLTEDIEVQPDLHVFLSAMKSEVARGPDVLVAVELSSTTQHYDLKVKMPIYAEWGVRELWVIDIEARTGLVFDRIEERAYAPGRPVGLQDVLTPKFLPAVSLRISDLF
ncbi:MAG: Uma2 family endonuclease [Vitreimonas sp.]